MRGTTLLLQGVFPEALADNGRASGKEYSIPLFSFKVIPCRFFHAAFSPNRLLSAFQILQDASLSLLFLFTNSFIDISEYLRSVCLFC